MEESFQSNTPIKWGCETDPLLVRRKDWEEVSHIATKLEDGTTEHDSSRPKIYVDDTLYSQMRSTSVSKLPSCWTTWAVWAWLSFVGLAMLGGWVLLGGSTANSRETRILPLLQDASSRSANARHELNQHMDQQVINIAAGCESTLVIVRHCEKDGPQVIDKEGNQHCSDLGWERAYYLATMFGSKAKARWPAPSYLFALILALNDRFNYREYETIWPLSQMSHLSTVIVRSQDEMVAKYFQLLKSGTMCGRIALVSWNHAFIPELAQALGCGPEHGCPGDFPAIEFDQMWQLRYIFDPPENHPYHNLPPRHLRRDHTNDGNTILPPSDQAQEGEDLKTHFDNTTVTPPLDQVRKEEDLKTLFDNEIDEQLNKNLVFSRHGWNVYPTIVRERFDPLAFSKLAGDYPPGGRSKGAHWMKPSHGTDRLDEEDL